MVIFPTICCLIYIRLLTVQCNEVHYDFTVQRAIWNPDGYPRAVIAVTNSSARIGVNAGQRLLPGPTIRARKGDLVTVTIRNKLINSGVDIHFHGLHMKFNAWNDGSAGVTQCPITPMTNFTYHFNLTQTGTYWYHGHSGHLHPDGLFGPMVVDYPDGEVDPVRQSFPYGADYTLTLNDWFHEGAEDLFAYRQSPYNSFRYSNGQRFIPNAPWHAASVLINGRGQFNCNSNNSCVNFFLDMCKGLTDCLIARDSLFGNCDRNAYPPDEFLCQGDWVRMRLIHAGIEAAVEFWIDGHEMTIVARDGVETVPTKYATVLLAVGQRLDVIVPCQAGASDKRYFIFARLNGHSYRRIRPSVWSHAFLVYGSGKNQQPPQNLPPDAPFPAISHGDFEYSLRPLKPRMAPPANRRIVVQHDMLMSQENGEPLEEACVNDVIFVMPVKPTLIESYFGRSPSSTMASDGAGPKGNKRQTNILQLQYGDVVEVVVVSIGAEHHPFHLHGYTAEFIKRGSLNPASDFQVKEDSSCQMAGMDMPMSRAVSIKKEVLERIVPVLNKEAAVLTIGDTFANDGVSYSVFRINLDNPGPWLLHCHINWHFHIGMAILFSVEKDGKYVNLLPPPQNFPMGCSRGHVFSATDNMLLILVLLLPNFCLFFLQ